MKVYGILISKTLQADRKIFEVHLKSIALSICFVLVLVAASCLTQFSTQQTMTLTVYAYMVFKSINSLLNEKKLDWSKLKAFGDDKINATEQVKFVLGRVENIVGK